MPFQLLADSETQMRNRLTVIKGYSQWLECITSRLEVDLQQIGVYSTTLSRGVVQCEQLLDQYFGTARLQWDATAIVWHAVEFNRLVQHVATRFVARVPPRDGRSLVVESSDNLHGVWDDHWLGEAVAAAVSNALTYSPTGTHADQACPHQSSDCGSPSRGPAGGTPRMWLSVDVVDSPPRTILPATRSRALFPVDMM